jgi:hypothetical protein
MFGRIFGRGKDETDQAVCAQCGRTLLVGEWTQNVVGADGQEYLICSLCGQSASLDDGEPVAVGTTPANNGRVRESRSEIPPAAEYEPEPIAPIVTPPAAAAAAGFAVAAERDAGADDKREARSESDAFWRALKEKDAEIERLQGELARIDAENQDLADQLAAARAQLGGEVAAVPREPLVPAAAALAATARPEDDDQALPLAAPESQRGDASEPGERTWGETPAEFATELAALRDAEAALEAQAPADESPVAETQPEAGAVPAVVFENTQPLPALTDEMIADDAAAAGATAHEAETTLTPETGAPLVAAEVTAAAAPPAAPEPTAAELEAEAVNLTLVQRGVDLLNVSGVPHKIADTSEQLGLPMVHVGFDGQTTVVTFLWTMGWYRFEVNADSGEVRMAERGYDERTDLRPNASVRADGTVQLAPAQISRAAAQKAPAGPEP